MRIFTGVPYQSTPGKKQVRIWTIHYRAHDGQRRKAFVVLPAWYGPRQHVPHPARDLAARPRRQRAAANAALWGALPARGMFAVISPEGAGRKLSRYSWGSVGQIDDLARMPAIARRTLPWLQIDSKRIYAIGGSMGGQETLLLLARHPRMLAGAAAFDSVADFARQYRNFPRMPCDKACQKQFHGPVGRTLQSLAREELGGTPRTRPGAYAVRSPVTYVRSIATSCVPLQLWWSVADRIVMNQAPAVRGAVQEDQGAEPEGADPGLRRLLGALARDAGRDAAAARARGLRPDPGAPEPALVRDPRRAGAGERVALRQRSDGGAAARHAGLDAPARADRQRCYAVVVDGHSDEALTRA